MPLARTRGGPQPDGSRGNEPLLPCGRSMSGSNRGQLGGSGAWQPCPLLSAASAFPPLCPLVCAPGTPNGYHVGSGARTASPAGPQRGRGNTVLSIMLGSQRRKRGGRHPKKCLGTGTPPTCGIRFPRLGWLSERGRSLRNREGTRAHESSPRRQAEQLPKLLPPTD